MNVIYLIVGPLLCLFVTECMATASPGYFVPSYTLSPDHRYGVTVPRIGGDLKLTDPKNCVVNLRTGILLGTIQQDFPAFDRMPHGKIIPCWWTTDDSQMLWQVDGKWGKHAISLLSLNDGKTISQVDLLKKLQSAILKATKEAAPTQFHEVEKENKGDGTAYPDGFTVDAHLESRGSAMAFPLEFQVFLTADPKRVVGHGELESRMDVIFNRNGELAVKNFHLGDTPSAPNWGP